MLLAMLLHSGVCSSHLQHLQDCAHLDLLIPHLPGELWISLYYCMEVRQSSLHANHCWPTCRIPQHLLLRGLPTQDNSLKGDGSTLVAMYDHQAKGKGLTSALFRLSAIFRSAAKSTFRLP